MLQGVNDTLVPVESARLFVERLRSVSRQPVAYAELPLAQHAFDVLASLRCQATTSAVADFLEAARSACGPAEEPGVTPSRVFSDVESAPEIVTSYPEPAVEAPLGDRHHVAPASRARGHASGDVRRGTVAYL